MPSTDARPPAVLPPVAASACGGGARAPVLPPARPAGAGGGRVHGPPAQAAAAGDAPRAIRGSVPAAALPSRLAHGAKTGVIDGSSSLRSAACSSTLRSSRMLPRQGCAQQAMGVRAELGRWCRCAGHVLAQRLDQRRDVAAPLAQRRHADRQHVEAGSTGPRGSWPARTSAARSREVAAIRRASSQGHELVAASGSISPLLQRAQQLGLQASGMSPISSRNSVPPSASWNLPSRPLRSAPVKRPARRRRTRPPAACRARRRCSRPPAAWRRGRRRVDGMRQHLLAGAGLAQQQRRAGTSTAALRGAPGA